VNRQGVWVPHQLSPENKAQRTTICSFLMTRQERKPFLHRVVTGDEKWIFYINNKRKKQWLSCGQTPVPTSKFRPHSRKALLCVWWDNIGVIHFEVLEPKQTITADFYYQQLERLNEALIQKRPALINRKRVILQHDNARPHSSKNTQQKIKNLGWEVLPYPPYSPDIAPSDYHLFRSLQYVLNNEMFKNIDDIRTFVSKFFDSKPVSFYKEGIGSLVKRWTSVFENDVNYIID
jgi:[histone H3]-lysine36 N-dimethyltransferase SETMAR